MYLLYLTIIYKQTHPTYKIYTLHPHSSIQPVPKTKPHKQTQFPRSSISGNKIPIHNKNHTLKIFNGYKAELYQKNIRDNISPELVLMISQELTNHIANLRLNEQDYSVYLNNMFDITGTLYYEHLQALLQHAARVLFVAADQLELSNNTKYLAKKYYDIFLSKFSEYSIMLILTCLRTATKFNQSHIKYSCFTIDYCVLQCSGQYSKKDFIQCEEKLLCVLDFNLRLVTPYQFIIVKNLLPHLKKSMNILNSVIDLALSVPQLRAASAEGIFFGSLLYSCEQKNQPEISFKIIKAITYKWQQAQQISSCLSENMKMLVQQ